MALAGLRKRANYAHPLTTRQFPSLSAFRNATGSEKHGVEVDYDVFRKVAIPDKSDPQRLYDPKDFDFRLKPNSAAVDKGDVLPSITDGMTGRAPDLGALDARPAGAAVRAATAFFERCTHPMN